MKILGGKLFVTFQFRHIFSGADLGFVGPGAGYFVGPIASERSERSSSSWGSGGRCKPPGFFLILGLLRASNVYLNGR